MADYKKKKGASGKKYTTLGEQILVTYTDGSTRRVKPGDDTYNATKEAMQKDIKAKKFWKPAGNSKTTAETAVGKGVTDGIITTAEKNKLAEQAQAAAKQRKQAQAVRKVADGRSKQPATEQAKVLNNAINTMIAKKAVDTVKSAPKVVKSGVEHGVHNTIAGTKQGAVSGMSNLWRWGMAEAMPYMAVAEKLGAIKPGTYTDLMQQQKDGMEALQRVIAENTRRKSQQISDKYGPMSNGEQFISDFIAGLLPMGAAVAGGAIAGPAGAIAPMYNYAKGASVTQALNDGADYDEAQAYGIGKGAVDTGASMIFKGMAGLPGKFKAGEKVAGMVTNPALKKAGSALTDVASEGAEEALAEIIDPLLQRATYNEDAKLDWNRVLESAIMGTLTAGAFNAGAAGLRNLPKIAGNVQQNDQQMAFDALHSQKFQPKQVESAETAQDSPEQAQSIPTAEHFNGIENGAQAQNMQADFQQKPVKNVQNRETVENTPKITLKMSDRQLPQEQGTVRNGRTVEPEPTVAENATVEDFSEVDSEPSGQSERKVSQFYTNTMQKTPLFTEAERNLFEASEYEYDVVSEKESLQRAAERLEKDYEGTKKELQEKEMLTGDDVDAAMFFVQEGLETGRETGDYSQAKAWVKKIQESATVEGRAVQALAKYSRTTAEGIMIQAEKYVKQSESALKTTKVGLVVGGKRIGVEKDSAKWRKVKAETEQATKAIEEAEVEASESAKKELEKRVKQYKAHSNRKAKPEPDLSDKLYKKVLDGFDSTLEGKGKISDKQIVDELYTKLKEEGLPDFKGVRKRQHTKLELLKDAVKRQDEYREVFERTQEYMKRKYGNDPETLSQITRLLHGKSDGKFENFNLDAVYSSKTLEGAISEVADLYGVDFKEIIKKNSTNKEVAKGDILNHILKYTKAGKEEADALADDIVRIFDEKIAERTEERIEQLKPKPETAKREVQAVEKLNELFNLGAYKDKRVESYKDKNLNKAVEQTAELLNIDLKKVIKENNGNKQQAANALYDYIRNNSELNENEANRLAADVMKTYHAELKRLTEVRLNQLFPKEAKQQEKGKRTAFGDLIELINLGAYSRQDIVDAIKQRNNLPVLTDADIKGIQENVEAANQYERYSYEWKKHMAKAQQIAADKMPQATKNKVTQLKRLMMLSNPRTDVRNITGNVPLAGTEVMSDVIGAFTDIAVSKVRGTDRTTTANPYLVDFMKGFGLGVKDTVKDIRNDVNTYRMGEESTTQYEMPRGRTFQNTTGGIRGGINDFLNGMDKIVNYGLMFGDRPFFEAHYAKRMAQLKQLGYDAEAPETKADAYAYAIDMVFQSNSDMAKGAGGMREALNNLFTINGFALGDFVLPFVQTPANIADKLLDYSPAGFVKAMGQAYNSGVKKTAPFDQRLFCQNIGRSLTGTAILGVGYALAKAGFITGSSDEDAEKRNAMTVAGWKPYSFYINGKYYDYSYIQPVGMLLAMAADAYQEGQSAEDLSDWVAVAGAGIKGGVDCFFNMSFFSSLTDFFGGYGSPAENMGSAFMDFPTQFAPAIFNAANKSIDPYQRETYDSDPLKRTINKFMAKTPLSQKLPIKQNVYGEDMMQNQGREVMKRTIENMLNPSTVSEETTHALNDELLRLNKDTGLKTQFLSYPDKKQDLGSAGVYKLNDGEEYNAFIKNANGYAREQMNKLIQDEYYKGLSDEEKIEALGQIEEIGTYKAKQELAKAHNTSYSTDEMENKLELLKECGNDYAKYHAIQNGFSGDTMESKIKKMEVCDKLSLEYATYDEVTGLLSALHDSTDAEGKTIKGKARKDKVYATLVEQRDAGKITDEQMWYIWVDSYNAKTRDKKSSLPYWKDCPYKWIVDAKVAEKEAEAEAKKNRQ